MTLYNKDVLNVAPQGGKFWEKCVWAGVGRTREG